MPYQLKTFQGSKYALFAYNAVGKEGGYADFTDFKMVEPLADRSHNIPLRKVIILTNLANGTNVYANPHGMMHSATSDSADFNGLACEFRVHDRGKGRVALEALNSTGFLTVVGIGIFGDVRMIKKESEASLFLWQDMLHNECMLLSLKTNRYVDLVPRTSQSYSADMRSALPTRKGGSVMSWKIVSE